MVLNDLIANKSFLFNKWNSLNEVIGTWLEMIEDGNSIQDGDTTSAEGSYTVAYPLAIIAKLKNRTDLMELAAEQLRIRKKRLVSGENLYLRAMEDGTNTFYNWGRAYAWYMLGLIRTLKVLKDTDIDTSDLQEEFKRISNVALSKMLSNNLWSCFVGEAETGVDTSASAGIAAALALGAKQGLLSKDILETAKATLKSLEEYLTPDGFLYGVAQNNRGGEELQRNGYRVMSRMAMGLMAQLMAATED